MPSIQQITNCLWFDTQAKEAAKFYTGIFPSSRIGQITHYAHAGQEIHGKPPGSVLTVVFYLNGQEFIALNGGPQFKFNESISLMVLCDTQEDLEYYWDKLVEGGEPSMCGWLKDKYGLSWQVAPTILQKMLGDSDQEKVERVFAAFMQMQKFDIKKLEEVFNGK